MVVPRGICAIALAGFIAATALSSPSAQEAQGGDSLGLSLARIAPDLHARLTGLERAQSVLFGALMAGDGKVDEAAVLQRLMRIADPSSAARPDPESEQGLQAFGEGAEIIRRAHGFHRELVAVYATTQADGRREALRAALRSYRSRPALALPDAPKDMTILYDHEYTSFVPPKPPETEPRRELAYPALTGFLWSAHWYELAVLETLDQIEDPAERDLALAAVDDRFRRKLTGGTPPDAFPTELPLAPAIAPGLVLLHDRGASVVDNLNMMLDVIMDVLVHPDVPDRRAAVGEVFARFMDREYRCVQPFEWIVVALRHSIFAQGGPALATWTAYERNGFSGNHGQHYGPRRAPPPCDPE